jgi:hypothetical protein
MLIYFTFFLSKKDGAYYITINKIHKLLVMPAVLPEKETGTVGHPCPFVTQFAELTKLTKFPVLRPVRRKPGLAGSSMKLFILTNAKKN